MKFPLKKQKQLKDKGKPDSPPMPGGPAMGRLRQFQEERGIDKTNLSNPASDEKSSGVRKRSKASKKR